MAQPPYHPHHLDLVADSQLHRTHTENPEAVKTEPDSTQDSKKQNRSHVKKSPLQNPNKLRRFGAQTQDRIGLESKLPMPDSPINRSSTQRRCHPNPSLHSRLGSRRRPDKSRPPESSYCLEEGRTLSPPPSKQSSVPELHQRLPSPSPSTGRAASPSSAS
jgi:hypothetical protein